MKSNGHEIKNIIPNSIAEELEIIPGSFLISINDTIVEDVFDYDFLIKDEYLEVLIREPDGEEVVFEIEKDFDEDLGLDFGEGLMDDYISCSNKCIFCFIDQMPKGMRDTLYFKDDDSRLSFLQGNYITLTNMKDKDIDRIVRYRMEPINISVQTTNPKLRCKMLNNRFAGDSLKHLDTLFKGEIKMNGQIVLCKNVNDKDELKRSIEDLSKYLPFMESVSVVPAGVTKFREGLYPLESFTKEDACEVIDLIENYQKKFYAKHKLHFIHASDEWYILAERDLPMSESYDGYLQLENGVGMLRLLMDEANEALNNDFDTSKKRTISIATGKLAYKYISTLSSTITNKYGNIKIEVYGIDNHFFGETITVSGLITGKDLINQLKGKELGSELLIPVNMLRSGEKVFLDDITIDDVERELSVKVRVVGSSGNAFINGIFGIDEDISRRQIYEQTHSCNSR